MHEYLHISCRVQFSSPIRELSVVVSPPLAYLNRRSDLFLSASLLTEIDLVLHFVNVVRGQRPKRIRTGEAHFAARFVVAHQIGPR